MARLPRHPELAIDPELKAFDGGQEEGGREREAEMPNVVLERKLGSLSRRGQRPS